MKIGIKCEIHDCTISLSQILEGMEIIPKGYTIILENDKKLRIDNQYYLKNKEVNIDYDALVKFVLKVKDIQLKMSSEKVKKNKRNTTTNPMLDV
jgi:hypothetical protein